jgi:hypothetical protein
MKLFFFSSDKGMGWERAEKSSLAQLHLTQVGPNLGSWQICPVKHWRGACTHRAEARPRGTLGWGAVIGWQGRNVAAMDAGTRCGAEDTRQGTSAGAWPGCSRQGATHRGTAARVRPPEHVATGRERVSHWSHAQTPSRAQLLGRSPPEARPPGRATALPPGHNQPGMRPPGASGRPCTDAAYARSLRCKAMTESTIR